MSGDDPFVLVSQNRHGVLLDTNVLLLLLVGMIREDLVEKTTRVRAYSASDYRLLVSLLQKARGLITTPHVATETWNLGDNLLSGEYALHFRRNFVAFIVKAEERWVRTSELTASQSFLRLGVADSGLVHIKRRRPVIVTDDSGLTRQLEIDGMSVVNFTHLRTFQ